MTNISANHQLDLVAMPAERSFPLQDMTTLTYVLKVLGDPTRWSLLDLLARQ